MKYIYYYNTSIGKLGIAEEKGFLTNICFITMKAPLGAKVCETDTTKEAAFQIREYLEGQRKSFDIPINPKGEKRYQRVFIDLLRIPYGEIITYKDLGIHQQMHPRAIGTIVSKNPLPIIIPCHRVLGSNGTLSGYIGGTDLKRKLLDIEGVDEYFYRRKG